MAPAIMFVAIVRRVTSDSGHDSDPRRVQTPWALTLMRSSIELMKLLDWFSTQVNLIGDDHSPLPYGPYNCSLFNSDNVYLASVVNSLVAYAWLGAVYGDYASCRPAESNAGRADRLFTKV